MRAPQLIRSTRLAAGLTQSDLALRLGTTQAAVARLESPAANPTVATLERALRAAGRRLELTAAEPGDEVDEAQIVAQLRLTPAERVIAHDRAYRNVAEMVRASRRLP